MRTDVTGSLIQAVSAGVGTGVQDGVEAGLQAINPTDVILPTLTDGTDVPIQTDPPVELGTAPAAVKALNIQSTFAPPLEFYVGDDAADAVSNGVKIYFNQGSLFQQLPFKMALGKKLFARLANSDAAPTSGYLVVNFLG